MPPSPIPHPPAPHSPSVPVPAAHAAAPDELLRVADLQMHFPLGGGMLERNAGVVKAVDGVSFSIRRGETLGLVGESGCGKSTTGRAILRLYKPTGGQVILEGQDITRIEGSALRSVRRRMQMIFQDPYASLNPRMPVGAIIAEPIRVHRLRENDTAVRERVQEVMELVGLNPSFISRYPHEFSGGQRQRIGIARALAAEPSFIVCDEPVSALDVSIQAQIINLLEELQHRLGLTYLFIAHDLSVVKHISNRVAVMYLGRVIEIAESRQLYDDPRHPYTRALLSAVPIPDPQVEQHRRRIILEGDVPSPINPPSGCTFHPRCPIVAERCRSDVPPLRARSDLHEVACWRSDESPALMPMTAQEAAQSERPEF